MSIIYNALQKTQKKRENKRFPEAKKRTRIRPYWKSISLSLGFTLLVLMIAHTYHPFRIHFSRPAPIKIAPPPPQIEVINEVEFKKNYILNGIFISEKIKLAMINNNYLKIGDSVGKMKISEINDNKVELIHGKQIIELEVAI